MDIEPSCDIDEGLCLHEGERFALLRRIERAWAAHLRAALPGRCDAGARALTDQCAFEFRERGHHVKNQQTSRGAGVDGFGDGVELHAFLPEAVDENNQTGQRAPETVETPHDEGVTTSQSPKGSIEPGAGEQRAGEASVFIDERAPCVFERIDLKGDILFVG